MKLPQASGQSAKGYPEPCQISQPWDGAASTAGAKGDFWVLGLHRFQMHLQAFTDAAIDTLETLATNSAL
ncbi:MAG: hypothetical protein AAGM84_14530 [Pseudomonadota bacterium]